MAKVEQEYQEKEKRKRPRVPPIELAKMNKLREMREDAKARLKLHSNCMYLDSEREYIKSNPIHLGRESSKRSRSNNSHLSHVQLQMLNKNFVPTSRKYKDQLSALHS